MMTVFFLSHKLMELDEEHIEETDNDDVDTKQLIFSGQPGRPLIHSHHPICFTGTKHCLKT